MPPVAVWLREICTGAMKAVAIFLWGRNSMLAMRATACTTILLLAGLVAPAQLPLVTPDKAEPLLGQSCVVEGTVLSATKTADACNLHFGKPAKTAFTVVVFGVNFSRWPGGDVAAACQGKLVRATGVVQKFRGRLEMVVADPANLVVSDGAAPAATPAAAAAAPTVLVGTNLPSASPATNVTPGVTMETGILPFTVDVRRFTGARRGTGAADMGYGAAFRQRVYVEATLQNVTSQPVSDLAWQWVAAVMSITGAVDTFYQGSETGIGLQRFEKRTLRSDEVKLSGVASVRYGTTSGTKVRGHYVKIFWRGQLVFKEASPPDIERDCESYLEKLQKSGKR